MLGSSNSNNYSNSSDNKTIENDNIDSKTEDTFNEGSNDSSNTDDDIPF